MQTVQPGISDSDLHFLKQSIDIASIVGSGEETHGTHEIFLTKARLAEYLISHMNFHTFVMENDWGSSQLIDAYINGGPSIFEQAESTFVCIGFTQNTCWTRQRLV